MATEALKILAIDDNSNDLITLKAVVQDSLPGAMVLTAPNGPRGIALAQAEDPDVILLDVVMPGMDGYAVCRVLKSDACLQDIPVVFITALRGGREGRIQAIEAGAEGFLAKPLDEVELVAQIRAMAKIKAANQMRRLEREKLAALVSERTRELEQELTERVRAEQALQQREAKFHLLFRNAPVGYQSLDQRGCILDVNDVWLETLGYTRDDVIGRWFGEFLAPEQRENFRTRYPVDMQARDVIRSVEYCLLRKDGTQVEAEYTARIGRDEQGRFERTDSVFQDITERKHAEAGLRRRAEELEALQATVLKITAPHDLAVLLQTIVERAAQLVGARGGGMYLCDPLHRQVRCVVSYNTPQDFTGTVLEYGEGAAGTVAQSGQPLIIDDYRSWDKRATAYEERQPFTTVLSAPMIWRGEVTGVIHVLSDVESKRFTGADLALLTLFASHAAIAVENTRLYEQAQQDITERKLAEEALATRAQQQSVIADLSSLALSTADLQTLFDCSTARVAETLRAEYCELLELLPDGSALKLVAGVGWPSGLIGAATVPATRASQAGFTMLTDQPVLVEDLRCETRFSAPALLLEQGVVSGLSVVILGAGQPFGVLGAHTTQRRAFAADDLHFLHAVANLLAAAIQRQHGEAALSAERSLLRTLVDHLPDAVYVKDASGRITLANPTDVRKAQVVSEAEMLGKTDFALFPPELAAAFAADDQQVLQMGRSVLNRQEQITRPDGSLGWQLTSKVPLRDSAGQVVGLVGIGHDITERVREDEEREQLLAQVQAQAQQIAQIMDSVPEGVLLLDAAGRVLQANPAGTHDLALLAGAAVGERLSHLGDLPLAELLAAAPGGGLWHEIRAGQRTVEVIARPVVAGTAGSLAAGHWVLVINDVTYARDMRQQLQQQERLAAVGQLAAGIAHDFNNILAIIALNAPRIALVPGLPPRDRERLTVIIEQTDHATRLVQQLLDFSRRAVLERRPLDLAPLLKEQVKLLERTLPETIAVSLACAPGEYVVLADPTRLQQMLMNLAVNARDAMPAGGSLHLALTRQPAAPRPELPDGPWVRLEVADSGSGITPEAQAHLFEPFFTTKPPGQGTGLGLAQVHGIVKQHEGEIVVHSAAGEGTSVSIFLPALARTAPAAATPEAAAQDGGGETILVVEDNPALLDAMSDLIVALGYQVVGASHGREALAVLEARGEGIALVLSDLMMPVMGGEALLAAIRARGLSVPVVMLSGYPLEGELSGLKAQGLAGWLLKPVRRAQLAELLGQVLSDS